MYVVDPSPSSETSSASAAVPTTTFIGSPCTSASNRCTNGSKSPASIMTAKYKMANISITPVGASLVMPATIISPSCDANPPATPNTIGTRINAVSGDMRFVMMSAMNAITMP
jgi:hypothetical protein